MVTNNLTPRLSEIHRVNPRDPLLGVSFYAARFAIGRPVGVDNGVLERVENSVPAPPEFCTKKELSLLTIL